MKTIILIFFLFSVSTVLADVDEDCLCIPENHSTRSILAIDSCLFYEIYDYEFECKNVLYSQSGSNLINNVDSSYVFGRRNIVITSKMPLFKNHFNKIDTLQPINNINEEYSNIIEFFKSVRTEFGEFQFYNESGDNGAFLEFDEFQSIPALKLYFSNINSIFGSDSIKYQILSFNVPTSNIKTNNQNTDLSINGNVLISGKEAIESVTVYDLYGREVESYSNINSSSLNLSGLKGALILQVKTNNTTHTIKYFNN